MSSDRLIINGVDVAAPSTEEPLTIPTINYDTDQTRDEDGRWADTSGGEGGGGGKGEKPKAIYGQHDSVSASHEDKVKEFNSPSRNGSKLIPKIESVVRTAREKGVNGVHSSLKRQGYKIKGHLVGQGEVSTTFVKTKFPTVEITHKKGANTIDKIDVRPRQYFD